jgi:nitroimidazol reductase NimA-like FMN-containing flavoprotein (pyridoxamine 5'-phosphate oxidase superfamily)
MTENGHDQENDEIPELMFTAPAVASSRGPRIRELKGRELDDVLFNNHVGRVAFMGKGRIELLPIHYVYVARTIVGRTAAGSKYLSWLTRDDVVFEVDESDGLFDWRSVVVRGAVTVLRAHGPEAQRRDYRTALAAFQTLVPSAFTEQDPTPSRTVVFAITPLSITGRQASTREAAGSAPRSGVTR